VRARIDIAYLESLGPSSLPALEWLLRQGGDLSQRASIASAQADLIQLLEDQPQDWRSGTLQNRQLQRFR
jgi:hypothetical protein